MKMEELSILTRSLPNGFPTLPQDWKVEFEKFPSPVDGTDLHVSRFYRKSERGLPHLCVLHGYGEHGGRYLHFPYYLQNTVDQVICLDQRGHGRSPGSRGNVSSFDDYALDALEWVNQEVAKGTATHLFGHSMGGLVALLATMKHGLSGVKSSCFCAPLLDLSMPVPFPKKVVAFTLSNIWGSLQIPSDLNLNTLSHDKSVGPCYKADLLNHNVSTPKWYVELLSATRELRELSVGMMMPPLFLVATDDRIVSASAIEDYFNQLNHPEKKLIRYEGFFHEIFNEGEVSGGIGREKAFGDLEKWIQKWN